MSKALVILISVFSLNVSALQTDQWVHALTLHGVPKYSKNFSHFAYSNPDAPQGGTIKIGTLGGFDTLNPFTAKGIAADYLTPLVFEEFAVPGLDEAFTYYGSVFRRMNLAADKLSMDVELHPKARFSDGKPVTVEDIQFSVNLFLSDKVKPFYRTYWGDIKEVKKLGNRKLRFIFRKVNAELPLIALQLNVLPKHIYSKGDFTKDFNRSATGTGPYRISKFKQGSFIEYVRNPQYWGKDLKTNRGKYNFERIIVKYYKDHIALGEALKKGDVDFQHVLSSKVWGRNLEGKRLQKKYIQKVQWTHHNNQGAQGFIFNLRRPIFEDVRVRKAISLAFDFGWSNKVLFYNQYTEMKSFFENSELAARGKITDEEQKILSQYKDELPADLFEKEMGYLGEGIDIKKRLRLARKLLDDAGFQVKEGVLEKDGKKLAFEFLILSPGFLRVIEPFTQNLRRIGIDASMTLKEGSVGYRLLQDRKFDMAIASFGQSQSPGNEQISYWGSEAADQPYSRNLMGLKNPVVDKLIVKIISASSREELVLYTRCLDRVLYHSHFLVPNWYLSYHRIALWNRFSWPDYLPKYYGPQQLLQHLWFDKEKNKKLKKAVESGSELEL